MINEILGVYFSSDRFQEEYMQMIDDASKKAFRKHSKALDKLYNMKMKNDDDKVAINELYNTIDDAITEACNCVGDALYKKGFDDAIDITGFTGIQRKVIESTIMKERERKWNETCENIKPHIIGR